MKRILAVIALSLCLPAFADSIQYRPCQGGHHKCNQGGDNGSESNASAQQQQQQGQAQESTLTSTNKAVVGDTTSRSQSAAQSGSVSGSRSNSGGNSLSNRADGGRSESSATGTGGHSEAVGGSVGDITGMSEGAVQMGGTTLQGGDVSVKTDNEYPAAQAAAIYADLCQRGSSGGALEGTFNVLSADPVCEHLKIARVALEAYHEELSRCTPRCEGVCSEQMASLELTCKAGKAAHYLDVYHDNMADANRLVQVGDYTAHIGKAADNLTLPAALLLALIFVL